MDMVDMGLGAGVMAATAAMRALLAMEALLAAAAAPLGSSCLTRLRRNWPTTRSGTCTAVTQGHRATVAQLRRVVMGATVMIPVLRQVMAGMAGGAGVVAGAAMGEMAVAALVC